jgi:hypothetical protein
MADRQPAPASDPRLRGFLIHLFAYFAVMVVLVVVNVTAGSQAPWFIWPAIAWMAPLALHAAYAMGLFDRMRE